MIFRFFRHLAVLSLLVLGASPSEPARAERLTLFAAASLQTALDQVVRRFEAVSGQTVATSYAGSSTLARQIDAGAGADLFISANTAWMDWLAARGGIEQDTRRDLLGNRLVLIAHGASVAPISLDAGTDLVSLLGGGRLAVALLDAVPAGIYAKAALEHLGLWSAVSTRLAEADNVRAALALVELGEAPLGIVYESDARASMVIAAGRISLIGIFPSESHPAIVYPAAVIAGHRSPAAMAFMAFLASEYAATIFTQQGFILLDAR